MSEAVEVLQINDGSDGDGRKWPKHTLTRNDGYFLERVGQMWAQYLPGGVQPGVRYRLNTLPHGYAGFEKKRPDGQHIDRWIYGHPNGQFRSLVEFFPHFKYLMDYGNPAGCTCKLCLGGGSKPSKSAPASRDVSETRPVRSRTTVQRTSYSYGAQTSYSTSQSDLDAPVLKKRKLTDDEGVQDMYELTIEKLEADHELKIDEPLEERMSPDWRTSHAESDALLREWRSLPRYVPRVGEIVLFTRSVANEETIVWDTSDKDSQFFRIMNSSTGELGDMPRWQAGVVTQMPQGPILDEDLVRDSAKTHSVIESGFRIEPMPQIGSQKKPESKRYTYAPLRHIRPLSLWSECMRGYAKADFPSTFRNALAAASSFCLVGKYRLKGAWPKLTVFAGGAYIGSELIVAGDTVSLLPRHHEPQDAVNEVMVITSVRLLFVNLDINDYGIIGPLPEPPYQTCLHIVGRVYTRDPARSFSGMGKVPISPDSGILPSGLEKYGPWYHYQDPKQPNLMVELPFQRILGRCYEDIAMDAWFQQEPIVAARSLSKAVSSRAVKSWDLSTGLQSVLKARAYSSKHDKRIAEGQSWFWADTRIEQLDLHEVNNRLVGPKDPNRTKGQIVKWRTSLKAMEGKKGAMAAFRNAKMQETAVEAAKVQNTSYGMVAASAPVEGGSSENESDVDAEEGGITDGDVAMGNAVEDEMEGLKVEDQIDEAGSEDENDEDEDEEGEEEEVSESDHLDEMELDMPEPIQKPPLAAGAPPSAKALGTLSRPIALSDSDEDSDDEETNLRLQQLSRNIRLGETRRGQ